MDPRTAIAEWKSAEPTAGASLRLMRRLLAHPRWLFLVDDAQAARLLDGAGALAMHCDLDAQGQRWRVLFSDDDALRAYLAQRGVASANHAAAAGRAVFAQLDDIEKISINPFTPHNVTYSRPQFAGLLDVAAAQELESALAQLQARPGDAPLLSQVKSFSNYLIGLREANGDRQLCLTTSDDGAEHAAAFTLDDGAWAFAERVRAAGGDAIAITPVAGDRLFELILRLNLAGVHFNPAGPGPEVRLPSEIARSVLAAP
jgi:hypothetical protein